MPSTSEKQRRFFFLVKGVQQGKVSPKRVGSKVTKAAKSMSTKSVDDFTKKKKQTKESINEMINVLKELRNDNILNEDIDITNSPNPISKTFTQKGEFESYVNRFSGLEIKPKEFEAVTNYKETKPNSFDKFYIRYENSDDFNNTTTTVIKKLREGNKLVFTVFQLNEKPEATNEAETPTSPASADNNNNPPPNTDNKPETNTEPKSEEPTDNPNEQEIVVKKSISFDNEVEGGKILSNLLQKLEI